jgi:hypothetical protein
LEPGKTAPHLILKLRALPYLGRHSIDGTAITALR